MGNFPLPVTCSFLSEPRFVLVGCGKLTKCSKCHIIGNFVIEIARCFK